ncbi:hypothetical protein OR263_34975 [Streptomyces sp. NEAU-H22]|uniref:hypothetical protein n=1 Tax=unclassified Streptomyces TaxID=2593676 RepID=UPI0022547984|nr:MULTISPECIES: hypothetical protein [unclassified Streptomyces]MCX3291847.1 hypothetical protein [Streptomyces sp. NEAU-H22]WMD06365.1 hypothetical protein Q7C01_19075 [Streptomyces sp. FXY-T5]
MTSNEAESTPVAADEGIQQIPAQITVPQPPAVTKARDALLSAVGTEAQRLAEDSAGQSSAALLELARAYALVTAGTTLTASAMPAAGHTRSYQAVEIGVGLTDFDR